jgi:hypothetical protein
MAFAPAAADASSALPIGQALKYKSCRRYPLHIIRQDFPLMGEYYCAHFMLLFGGT